MEFILDNVFDEYYVKPEDVYKFLTAFTNKHVVTIL